MSRHSEENDIVEKLFSEINEQLPKFESFPYDLISKINMQILQEEDEFVICQYEYRLEECKLALMKVIKSTDSQITDRHIKNQEIRLHQARENFEKKNISTDHVLNVKKTQDTGNVIEENEVEKHSISSGIENSILDQSLKQLIENANISEQMANFFTENIRRLQNKNAIGSLNDYLLLKEINLKQTAYLDEIRVSTIEKLSAKDENFDGIQVSIQGFKSAYKALFEERVIELLENLLVDEPVLHSAFFAGIELTKKNITDQYKLFCHLHPDKILKDEYKIVFDRFFKILVSAKIEAEATLEKQTEKLGGYIFHTERAGFYWQLMKDYLSAYKEENKFQHLKLEDVRNLTKEEKFQYKKDAATLAFQNYRAMLQIVDEDFRMAKNDNERDEIKRKQIECRKYAAIALIAAELYFDAQVYVIGACHILMQCIEPSEKKLKELQEILGKIKQFYKPAKIAQENDSVQGQTTPADTKSLTVVSQTSALQPSSDMSLYPYNSPMGKEQRRKSIQDDVSNLMLQLLATPENRIVSYVNPREPILQAKQQATLHKISGTGVATTGIIVAAGSVAAVSFDVITALGTGAAMGTILGPVGTIVGGVLGLAAGIAGVIFGVQLFRKGTQLFQEPEIREKLNEIISTAIEHHQKNKHKEFLEVLSKPYIKIDSREEVLFEMIPNEKINTRPDKLIKTLLKHGFRPDGIAYLLTILGEALLSRQVKFHTVPESALNEQAANLFEAVVDSKELLDKANELDGAVQNAQKKCRIPLIDHLKQFFAKEYYGIPESYLKDAIEAPFNARLSEMKLTAQLNYALVQVVIGGKSNLELAQEHIINMYEATIHKYQYFSVAEHRLAAVEDLLIALGFNPNLDAIFNKSNPYLSIEAAVPIVTDSISKDIVIQSVNIKRAADIDALALINYMSGGIINFSRMEFLNKIREIQGSDNKHNKLAQKLLSQLEKVNIVNCQIFNREYLSLIISILRINLKLYVLNKKGTYELLPNEEQPIVLEDSPIVINLHLNDSAAQLPIAAFQFVQDRTLRYFDERLALVPNQPILRASIFFERGNHYSREAGKVDNRNHIRSLMYWNNAKNDYRNALSLDPLCLHSIWGFARCELAMGNPGNLLTFLNNQKQKHSENSRYWYYKARALRKLQKYSSAVTAMHKAIELEPSNTDFQKELKIINNFTTGIVKTRVDSYQNTVLQPYEENDFIRRQDGENEDYNILSIDGGGIRGLVPAMLLAELERRAHKPASHLFHMMAGTSTGAIISLGLSTPAWIESENKWSTYISGVRASDIVDLYTKKGAEIFNQNNFFVGTLWGSKYKDEGRLGLFTQYYRNVRLSSLLTDIVVPAVSEERPYVTTIFSKDQAKTDSKYDFKVVDVAMATSAAPTYFPSHPIRTGTTISSNGNEVDVIEKFVDGGVQVNNPAQSAYDFAQKKIDSKKIRLWSLGTGDCVNNSLNPNASRGMLFWAANLHKMLWAQQNNVDDSLKTTLGSRYNRYQFWMEKPIQLDSIEASTIEKLCNIGQELIEEMDASDENSLNTMVEALTKGNGTGSI